jgi:maltose-binding protein MalE
MSPSFRIFILPTYHQSLRLILGMICVMMFILGVPSIQGQDDATATAQVSESEVRTVTIWLPVDMISPNDETTLALLNNQLEVFSTQNTNINVDVRFKRVSDVGGILPTLRTASAVAPEALPDMTLMRRQDLVTAQRAGLIQSLENLMPSALLVNLQQRLSLGQIDSTLYGLPYLMDVLHMAYYAQDEELLAGWSYADVLQRQQQLLVPLGRVTGIPAIVYAQYLNAGGRMNPTGTLVFDETVIDTTLSFYEQLRQAELIPVEALDYLTPADYWGTFETNDERAVLVNSNQYLQRKAQDPMLRASALPTNDGEPVTLMNGWVWVMVTSAPEQQEIAVALLDWLLLDTHQIEVATALSTLPALPVALSQVVEDDADLALYTTLIANAHLPLTEGEGDAFSRALENAVVAIMRDERTASEATADIQAAIAGE